MRNLLLLFCFIFATLAHAEEFLGGPVVSEVGEENLTGTAISESDRKSSERNRFEIGGDFTALLQGYFFDSTAVDRDVLRNPNTFRLYGEGKLNDENRILARGKLVLDSTLPMAQRQTTELEELKLQYRLSKWLFLTFGRQKNKWGTGRVWNVTDFVNTAVRDPLALRDERSGVSFAKFHMPIGRHNLYVLAGPEDASRFQEISFLSRIEAVLGSSEWALSTSAKRGRHPRFGADTSFALWNFDLYGEVATPTEFRVDWIAGLSYEWSVFDNDVFRLGLEYFDHPSGFSDSAGFTRAAMSGAFMPFYMARRYAAAVLSLPAPSSLNDWTFQFFEIEDFAGASRLSQFGVIWKPTKELEWYWTLGLHWGKAGGEWVFGGQQLDTSLSVRATF